MPGGLLGADYEIENGRYRFARVYNGENWNPQLRAPLTQPGVNVAAGEYLLAVNGREVRAADNVYSFFEATAGQVRGAPGGARPLRRRRARRHGGSRGQRDRPAQPGLDRGQPPQGGPDSARAASPTSTCPTPPAAATPTSTATSSRRSARRAR